MNVLRILMDGMHLGNILKLIVHPSLEECQRQLWQLCTEIKTLLSASGLRVVTVSNRIV